MKRFAVIATDPTVDIYAHDDFYGVEVVDAADEREAEEIATRVNHPSLRLAVVEVFPDTPLGWHDSCDFWMVDQ